MQRFLLGLARRAVRIYYRIEVLGAAVPARGPVLLVANHPNGLVDPVLLAGATARSPRFLGMAPLFAMPVLGSVMRGLDALPVYRPKDGADTRDNAGTFEAVFAALARGELVCLFPEGTSHDAPTLLKLKTGAARMALGAEARGAWQLDLHIVPVGLVYRAKLAFQSRVAVWVGSPIVVADLRAEFERDERGAVGLLTERITAGLASVTLDLERWEDLPLLELAERVLFGEASTSAERLARLQAFARALRTLRTHEPARVAELSARLSAFGQQLARLGLATRHVPERLELPYRAASVLRFALRALVMLGLVLPLACLGALFWWLPYRIAGAVPARFATPDILATLRILTGFVLFPAWLAFVCVLLAWRLDGRAAAAAALVAPVLGLLALSFRGWRIWAAGEVRTFLRLASRARLRALLVAERTALARELEELRARI